ncbi:MAG TPA: phosphoribosylformylglycinamidine synthase subunit PurQ [Hellea balneolensis]|uniref:Phosphoribosylformylglycinamidine synthase subunit PurQ n=1 Tax=Hellea balneolensis TaxID=287478 RepID=A0A7C5QZR1_9PROT|nr:phosphoribosylformylglycinamidine synthase subunit PurQ [Hellea balneolensis]
MRSAVIVFPASNCDRDAAVALEAITGRTPVMVWHEETSLPKVDFVVIPGGFSYGDYLRSGAIAARAPIISDIVRKAATGLPVAGFCNGFQILTECGLLPGALMRNTGLRFVCRPQKLSIANHNTMFTKAYKDTTEITVPIAHFDGNYFADKDTLNRLKKSGRIVFKYVDNPNGSALDIAGICNEAGNVLGMMPHPERAVDPLSGGTDGVALFKSVLESLR